VTAIERPRVTLIIPVRNEAAHIRACLDSVRKQSYPTERLEILVVDGASTDVTPALVQDAASVDPRVRLLENPSRTMPTGLNLGIREAAGDLIGVVSGHSVLGPDYVERAVDAIETTQAWSVGGRIVRRTHGPMHRAIAIATASPVGVGDSSHNYATEAGWVETVFPGFWRRQTFDRVGSFDPAMVANEDNELSYRIRRAGGGIWYDPAITVEYVPRSTIGGLFHQYRRYAMGKVRVFRKHGGGLRWRHLVPAAWLAFLVSGGILAAFSTVIALVWGTAGAAYLLAILVASVRLAEDGVAWWRVAAALVTLHLAYGIGTWQGVLTWRG